ncbi:hypothetical protein MARINON1_52491 [Marinobacter salarius]|nr:hypothetical protein MARINON1_52491 [Marinobacter salarius]
MVDNSVRGCCSKIRILRHQTGIRITPEVRLTGSPSTTVTGLTITDAPLPEPPADRYMISVPLLLSNRTQPASPPAGASSSSVQPLNVMTPFNSLPTAELKVKVANRVSVIVLPRLAGIVPVYSSITGSDPLPEARSARTAWARVWPSDTRIFIDQSSSRSES